MNIADRDALQIKVLEAYSRFKAHIYYDNFNLLLRKQLSSFESQSNFKQKLDLLSTEIFNYLQNGKLSGRIIKMIRSSGYIVLPKTFDSANSSHKKTSILISNQNTENYRTEANTILFHGTIELHILATLWIMEEGVKLNKKIGWDSYGYHLPMAQDETKLGTEKLLFTKYFKKYQEWRDKGIKAAKNQIDDGNDVLLVSLDIKNFYHSCHINFDELKKDLNNLGGSSLTHIIEMICVAHTKKLNIKNRKSIEPLLPIGLVSSGVIANWLLSSFDKELKDKMSPVYYGRYVDDFFIVISNVRPPDALNGNSPDGNQQDTYKVIEWLENRFFTHGKPLKVVRSDDDALLEFSDEKYKGLQIQGKKLKLFYFSPDWPHAMLNNFQKALQENSSAFWFLPNEEDLKDSLDDDAYDMQYEDTINKFRSVADVKTSKYGASVFLAKRIKLAILHTSSPDEKITKEIFRFFKGVSILALYSLWEKVFTYLVVTNDLKTIRKITKQIFDAISKLEAGSHKEELIQTLTQHFSLSFSMAFSLNPSLLDVLIKQGTINTDFLEQVKCDAINLRLSLLTRHHYLPLPSLILTDYYLLSQESLLSDGLFEKLLDLNSPVVINQQLVNDNWRIPRWMYLQEICLLNFIIELRNWKLNNEKPLFYDIIIKDKKKYLQETYIRDSTSLFEKLNKRKIKGIISTEELKVYREDNNPKIYTTKVELKNKNADTQLLLGLSNMYLDEKDLKAAISKKSSINREKRGEHIEILNQAERIKIDLLILPETSVPIDWLYAYADEARRKQRAFIFGLEHFTMNNFVFNFSVALLPIEIGKMKEVLLVPRLKNHYSPEEEVEIKKIGKEIPRSISIYYLFKWSGIQFAVYNCYELTDVVHRSIFRSDLDVLFAIEYNKDTNYFSNIAEATCRDLHCYYVQANSSLYGDSRVVEPRKTEQMNPVRIKGGENNVILRYALNILKLREFQVQRLPYQLNDKTFKTTPPDFNHDKVNNRGKN